MDYRTGDARVQPKILWLLRTLQVSALERDRVVGIAEATGARLEALHIQDHSSERGAVVREESACEKYVVLSGDPARTICWYANSTSAEMVLLPVHRSRRWSRLWTRLWKGSVTAAVLGAVAKPVLLTTMDMRPSLLTHFDRILVVPQLDEHDGLLWQRIHDLPRSGKARIHVLYVVPEIHEGMLGAIHPAQVLSERVAMERLRRFAAQTANPCTFETSVGDIHVCIASVARKVAADLIVVRRSKQADKGIFVNPLKMLHKCRTPILSVPVPTSELFPARMEAARSHGLSVVSRSINAILRTAVGLVLWATAPALAQKAPPSPDRPVARLEVKVPRDSAREPHEIEMDRDRVYTLSDLIDIAETRNPATRVAWASAKQRAASVGVARSELMPTVIGAALTRTLQEPLLLYDHFQLQDIGLVKTVLRMNYTLFDFGARRSEIDAAKARLLEADLHFNDTHLQIIYDVARKYYDLQNASGLRMAADANLRDFKALEQAAQERLDNGLATRPDVLEARASAARAEYELQSAVRNEEVVFGNLATTLTASPRFPFHVQPLDELSIPETLPETEEAAEERAFRERPDLLGRMAGVQAASSEVRHARSAYFPKLEFEGDAGWLRAWGQQERLPSIYGHVKVYDARVTLRWTVFDGLRRESELARAKAERAAAEAEVKEARDHIADQVWTAYRNAETALQQRKAARALLQAATESYSAAQEAYGYGVRNILDVLDAERVLSNARAADVTARAGVLNGFNELAYRTGRLLFDHPTGARP